MSQLPSTQQQLDWLASTYRSPNIADAVANLRYLRLLCCFDAAKKPMPFLPKRKVSSIVSERLETLDGTKLNQTQRKQAIGVFHYVKTPVENRHYLTMRALAIKDGIHLTPFPTLEQGYAMLRMVGEVLGEEEDLQVQYLLVEAVHARFTLGQWKTAAKLYSKAVTKHLWEPTEDIVRYIQDYKQYGSDLTSPIVTSPRSLSESVDGSGTLQSSMELLEGLSPLDAHVF